MEPESHLAGGEEALTREPAIADVVTICRWLNEAGANYVLVGGFAIVLHGYPRFTADIDLLTNNARQGHPGPGLSQRMGAAEQCDPGPAGCRSCVGAADSGLDRAPRELAPAAPEAWRLSKCSRRSA